MDAQRVRLSAGEAHALAVQVLRRVGYTEENARIVGDHLIDAALCGYEYSGLPKILEIVEAAKASQPRTPITVVRETGMSTLIDGGNHVGMITMHHATDLAIRKASEHGFAVVGVANSWMSGRSAYYVERVARAGLIGIHTVSSSDLVAPPGAARAAMGTNPIAFGFPGQDNPLVIDMGTSAIMGTEVGLIRRRGDLLPEGVAIDRDGAPTRDPEAVREGAFLHLAGYKGFALALAMKALGVFAGSGLSPNKDYGYLMIAMKPDLLVPLDEFKAELMDMLARVRSTPRQPGVEAIRIPSERSFRDREINREAGIEIDAAIHRSLLALGS